MVILSPPGPLPILHRLDTNPRLYLVLPLHRQHGRRFRCAGLVEVIWALELQMVR